MVCVPGEAAKALEKSYSSCVRGHRDRRAVCPAPIVGLCCCTTQWGRKGRGAQLRYATPSRRLAHAELHATLSRTSPMRTHSG